MKILEQQNEKKETLFVLIHGIESSKSEWLEKDGYTKGGNLTSFLNENWYSWIASDLYGHGDFTADEKNFDNTDISDELWPKFISRSVESLKNTVSETVKQYGYTSVSLLTYSAGSGIAMFLLKEELLFTVDSLYMASFCPERKYDDEFSMHNNLDLFKGRAFYGFSGSRDEDVPLEDAKWVFDQLPSTRKKHLIYDAGHSLPVEWVKDFQALLAEEQLPETNCE